MNISVIPGWLRFDENFCDVRVVKIRRQFLCCRGGPHFVKITVMRGGRDFVKISVMLGWSRISSVLNLALLGVKGLIILNIIQHK